MDIFHIQLEINTPIKFVRLKNKEEVGCSAFHQRVLHPALIERNRVDRQPAIGKLQAQVFAFLPHFANGLNAQSADYELGFRIAVPDGLEPLQMIIQFRSKITQDSLQHRPSAPGSIHALRIPCGQSHTSVPSEFEVSRSGW